MFNNEKIHISSLHQVLYIDQRVSDSKMKISFVTHGHTKITHYEFHYRISGESTIFFEGKTIHSKPGMLYYIPQKSNAEYWSKPIGSVGTEKIIIFVETESLMPQELLSWDISNNKTLVNLILKLNEYWHHRSMTAQGYYLCMTLLYQILYELSVLNQLSDNSRIAPAIEYINKHFTDTDIDVENLSRLCGLSHSHFKRLFIEKYSMPPKSYIQKKRMEYAKMLLSEKNMNVNDVAIKSGFSNQSYFSRAYKNYHGISPKQFKISVSKK